MSDAPLPYVANEDALEEHYLTLPLGLSGLPDYEQTLPSFDSIPLGHRTPAPDYSCQLLPNEVYLDGTPSGPATAVAGPSTSPVTASVRRCSQFRFRYGSMVLTLNSRSVSTQTPAYGRGECIEGTLHLEGGLKYVEKVELRVNGIVATTFMNRGAPISRTTKVVLDHIQILYPKYPSSIEQAEGKGTHEFPICFQLPETVQGSNAKLPPSLYALHDTAEASVRYTISVEIHKKGLLRRNEKIETVFLYLPKTSPPSRLPPSWYHFLSNNQGSSRDVKIPIEAFSERCEKEWKSIPLIGDSRVTSLSAQLSLMKPLIYQANRPIPICLTVTSTTPVMPDLVLSSAEMVLVKTTRITLSGTESVKEEIIGVADFGKPDSPTTPPDDGRTARMICGSITGGKEQGEISWAVEGMVEVKYALCLNVKPALSLEGIVPTYRHREPIELTTHSADDADNFDGIMDGPALGIIGRL